MNSEHQHCKFCGGEILFRTINGTNVPIHIGKDNCIGNTIYRYNHEGFAHNTQCPKCDKNVVFLCHNGGCVWLDALGWPWPKHSCFIEETNAAWAEVFPAAAVSSEKAHYRIAKALGRLNLQSGIVVLLGFTKQDLRAGERAHPSWLYSVHCQPANIEKTEALLDIKPVIVNLDKLQMYTLDGSVFTIQHHQPKYYGKS